MLYRTGRKSGEKFSILGLGCMRLPLREDNRIDEPLATRMVRYAIEQGKGFHQLSLDEYRKFSPYFEQDVYSISLESSLAARNLPGGTAPEQVAQALQRARRTIDES